MGLSMMNRYTVADLLPATWVVLIGIAEVAHLIGVFLGCSFEVCCLLQGVAVLLMLVLSAVCFIWMHQRNRKKAVSEGDASSGKKVTGSLSGRLLLILFLLIVITQVIFVLWNPAVYRQGDMTVETVGSFIQNDGIYRVNPLTGQVYQQGIPSRLKILCLPTLYGGLSALLPLSVRTVVWRVVPVLVLLGSYGAYATLGKSLFGENRKRRGGFLLAVSLVLWAGCYLYGMDGFGVLYTGWRGVTIRNAVLIPWTLSLCLRRKWLCVVLCVVAEACIVWTLYGCGACLLVALGVGGIEFALAVKARRAATEEKEA